MTRIPSWMSVVFRQDGFRFPQGLPRVTNSLAGLSCILLWLRAAEPLQAVRVGI